MPPSTSFIFSLIIKSNDKGIVIVSNKRCLKKTPQLKCLLRLQLELLKTKIAETRDYQNS